MRVSGKGLIDRKTVLNFKFNGQPFQGFAGDTSGQCAFGERSKTCGKVV